MSVLEGSIGVDYFEALEARAVILCALLEFEHLSPPSSILITTSFYLVICCFLYKLVKNYFAVSLSLRHFFANSMPSFFSNSASVLRHVIV